MPLDETLRKTTMHMILCEPNFGKRILDPQFITIPPPLYEGPEDEVSCYPIHIGTILKASSDDFCYVAPTLGMLKSSAEGIALSILSELYQYEPSICLLSHLT